MSKYVARAGLQVDSALAKFIESEALSGLDLATDPFWDGLAKVVADFVPRNRQLLAVRDQLQAKIDDWHRRNGPVASDPAGYEQFLRDIGYLEDLPADFAIETMGLDPEITTICGPQLVVPVSNARYALNAANARWGSLYNAFYGTDVIAQEGDLASGAEYNGARGAVVFEKAAQFLDQAFPLASGSHSDVSAYEIEQSGGKAHFWVVTGDGVVGLADPAAFVGYRQQGDRLAVLLAHHGLHVELIIDRGDAVGGTHKAGLADILVEAAISTIQDCEDSVAAVDAIDKIGVYRNWLGLMDGTLGDKFVKNGKLVERVLQGDRPYTDPEGKTISLKGRALLLIRNVGHLMTTDAVLDKDGAAIGEGILDAVVTVLCALHDRAPDRAFRNSETGAIYIVKPKMHGPAEVAFACDLFGAVEDMLGLTRNSVKIGIMDEERRTSANLKAAIFAARARVFFINTGFLDRTGDEIHTAMEAGPVLPKDQIKSASWIGSYEDRNVLIGLECGLSGKAQIGKGMWAMPDEMAKMLETKAAHPKSGANTAWVPSPTAATLHAMHYHEVDVFEAQKRRHNEATPPLAALFSMPLVDANDLNDELIERELENNAQSILGYVVRWVAQGVGCSKVPDINDVGLMEDRATLRISSQHIANWVRHGIVSADAVKAAFERMSIIVDGQNEGDPIYVAMAPDFANSIPFQAALKLALAGTTQPSGYTEPILHAMRAKMKAAAA